MVLKNIISVFIPTLLSIIFSVALNEYSLIQSKNWLAGLGLWLIICVILNLIYTIRAGTENFTELLIVAIVLKLLLALILIVIYSFIDKPGFFNFCLHFILQYILFTIFEIRYLLFLIKKHAIHEQT